MTEQKPHITVMIQPHDGAPRLTRFGKSGDAGAVNGDFVSIAYGDVSLLLSTSGQVESLLRVVREGRDWFYRYEDGPSAVESAYPHTHVCLGCNEGRDGGPVDANWTHWESDCGLPGDSEMTCPEHE